MGSFFRELIINSNMTKNSISSITNILKTLVSLFSDECEKFNLFLENLIKLTNLNMLSINKRFEIFDEKINNVMKKVLTSEDQNEIHKTFRDTLGNLLTEMKKRDSELEKSVREVALTHQKIDEKLTNLKFLLDNLEKK